MLILSSIAIDPNLSAGGVWAPYMGGEFLLARRGPGYDARLGELYNENVDLLKSRDEKGLMPPAAIAKMQEIYTIAFCEHCLIDWKNVGEKGKKGEEEIKYTPELGIKLLMNPVYSELAKYLENFSQNHAHYRAAAEHSVATTVKTTAVS